MLKLTGLLALFASAALALFLARGFRRVVLTGEVCHRENGRIWLDPDEETNARYVSDTGTIPRLLHLEITSSIRSGHVWLVVGLPDVPQGANAGVEAARVDHREWVLPGGSWGVGRTTVEVDGRERRASPLPVFAAYAGASAAPLGLWAVAAIGATLAAPRRRGIMEAR